MAAGHRQPRETKTLQFARWVTRNRFWVALMLIGSTGFFAYPIFNTAAGALGFDLQGPKVRIDTNARALFPDHPFIHAQDKFATIFGSSSLVAISVLVEEGTIFTPENIGKIREITRRLDRPPPGGAARAVARDSCHQLVIEWLHSRHEHHRQLSAGCEPLGVVALAAARATRDEPHITHPWVLPLPARRAFGRAPCRDATGRAARGGRTPTRGRSGQILRRGYAYPGRAATRGATCRYGTGRAGSSQQRGRHR